MRPPEFTGGNHHVTSAVDVAGIGASMRPPEFTGGNKTRDPTYHARVTARFNEAAGIHRRKRDMDGVVVDFGDVASMRPPEFTGGNPRLADGTHRQAISASMRPPEFTGGNGAATWVTVGSGTALQ